MFEHLQADKGFKCCYLLIYRCPAHGVMAIHPRSLAFRPRQLYLLKASGLYRLCLQLRSAQCRV
jgi:hypothetical protein